MEATKVADNGYTDSVSVSTLDAICNLKLTALPSDRAIYNSYCRTMKLLITITLACISSSIAFSGVSLLSSSSTTSSISSVSCLHEKRNAGNDVVDVMTRRETIKWIVGGVAAVGLTSPNMAMAFPNKISNQYDDRPRQRGSKVSYIIIGICYACKKL